MKKAHTQMYVLIRNKRAQKRMNRNCILYILSCLLIAESSSECDLQVRPIYFYYIQPPLVGMDGLIGNADDDIVMVIVVSYAHSIELQTAFLRPTFSIGNPVTLSIYPCARISVDWCGESEQAREGVRSVERTRYTHFLSVSLSLYQFMYYVIVSVFDINLIWLGHKAEKQNTYTFVSQLRSIATLNKYRVRKIKLKKSIKSKEKKAKRITSHTKTKATLSNLWKQKGKEKYVAICERGPANG